jgi:hypothetical protein
LQTITHAVVFMAALGRHSVVFFAAPSHEHAHAHINMATEQPLSDASSDANSIPSLPTEELAHSINKAPEFLSVDCDSGHNLMQAFLQKPAMQKAVRIPSPVPGLMMVVGTHSVDGVERRRLFMVMMNQVPGIVSILPPFKKLKRRALMFSGILPCEYMQDKSGGLCIVNLSDVQVFGRRHKWQAFDAPMCHADGTPMSDAELRKHSVKTKDGKARRNIMILGNVLVTDQCTWFLMSLAGQFRVEEEHGNVVGASQSPLVEYGMSVLPFARLQTAVTVVRRNPPVPVGTIETLGGTLTATKPSKDGVMCSVGAMEIDVPYDLALTAPRILSRHTAVSCDGCRGSLHSTPARILDGEHATPTASETQSRGGAQHHHQCSQRCRCTC